MRATIANWSGFGIVVRIWLHLVGIVMLALWVSLGAPAPVGAWQTIPLTGASGYGPGTSLRLVASAEALLPVSNLTVVWLVEHQAGTNFRATNSSLTYRLPRPPLPNMHGEHGAAGKDALAGRALRFAPGETLPLLTAMTDAEVAVRFSVVPLDMLPPGTLTSAAFAAPGNHLRLELREGRLAPGEEMSIPGRGTPVVLLASDNPLHIAQAGEGPLDVARGELALLTANAMVRNDGARVATFAVARITTDGTVQGEAAPAPGDPVLDEAWQRFGCHLNPGNPACLTVGLVSTCATNPNGPGCRDDSDGDSCLDIAEVQVGLDPFAPGDCLGSREGEPLLNCLFLTGRLSCDGSGEGDAESCGAEEIDLAGQGERDGCAQESPPLKDHSIDCQLFERDPVCDGFPPRLQ